MNGTGDDTEAATTTRRAEPWYRRGWTLAAIAVVVVVVVAAIVAGGDDGAEEPAEPVGLEQTPDVDETAREDPLVERSATDTEESPGPDEISPADEEFIDTVALEVNPVEARVARARETVIAFGQGRATEAETREAVELAQQSVRDAIDSIELTEPTSPQLQDVRAQLLRALSLRQDAFDSGQRCIEGERAACVEAVQAFREAQRLLDQVAQQLSDWMADPTG